MSAKTKASMTMQQTRNVTLNLPPEPVEDPGEASIREVFEQQAPVARDGMILGVWLAAMLEFGSVTTAGATRFLDIIDPRARTVELCRQGYRILTMPVARATECGVVHVVGRYLLLFSTLLTSAASDSADWVQVSLPLSAFDDRSMNFQVC
jgi:hypothetical protein